MDLNAIAPIIENKFKEALAEKRYPFGFAKKQGISNKIATGSLYNSVKVSVVPGNNTEIIQITMNDYGQWVQSGRLRGKKGVPIDALEKWIKRRSLAFAIQTNIKKFGIKASNWYDVAIDKVLEDNEIIELLEGAAIEDLINAIEGI
jgi:hypothetical protein